MSDLRVWINGEDAGDSFRDKIKKRAEGINDKSLDLLIEGESSILSLREAINEADFLARYVELMRNRVTIDPSQFKIVSRPGLLFQISGLFRKVLWRVLKYQHDWFVFYENSINCQFVAEIDYLHEELRKRLTGIEKRLALLEEKITGLAESKNEQRKD